MHIFFMDVRHSALGHVKACEDLGATILPSGVVGRGGSCGYSNPYS